jgi:hypothetical protein
MLSAYLDHIVIIAPSLETGAEYIRRSLGVELQPGGEHARMGTHNRLLRLGESTYLEVLAINPDAPQPDRPRWFDLDRLAPDAAPRLEAWVARVDDIDAAAGAAGIPLGNVEPMSRGALDWRITIPPADGLPLQGVAPLLIQWLSGPHPAAGLPEQGCRLLRMEGIHPQARLISRMLASIGFVGDFSLAQGEKPRLVATILSPRGEIRIE